MMRSTIIWISLLLSACSIIEPDSQSNIVSRALISPGALDSAEFRFTFFNEGNGQEFPVEEFTGSVKIIGAGNREFRLNYTGADLFEVRASDYNLRVGDIVFLKGEWEGFEISAQALIPNSPEELDLSTRDLIISTQEEDANIEISWEPKDDLYLLVRIIPSDSIVPFPEAYVAALPEDRVFLVNLDPSGSGRIILNPWDFDGTGVHEVQVFWFNEGVSNLYQDPIQSGIFPKGNGILEGLGYFEGFDADTFLVDISF